MSAFRFVVSEALGYAVVEVDGLRDGACVVPSQSVVLVRAGLSDDAAEEVERRLLPMLIAAGGEQS